MFLRKDSDPDEAQGKDAALSEVTRLEMAVPTPEGLSSPHDPLRRLLEATPDVNPACPGCTSDV